MSDYKTELKTLKPYYFAALIVSGVVNAFGVIFFLYPVSLFDSGFSGTSMFLADITGLPLGLFLLLLNIPFFAYGLKKQGLAFTIYSIFAVVIYSLTSYIITFVLPVNVTDSSPLAGTDLLLCAVFGGLISGVGSGLTIRFGGAIDGIEVLAVIFSKKLGITVGTFVMIYNVILYVIIGIAENSWILPMYSIITYAAALKTVDFIVEGFDKAKAAIIITKKADEISAMLSESFGCGVTLINAQGYYLSEDKTVIYFVVNRFQIGRLKEIVSGIDPQAYVTINEISDVLSNSSRSSINAEKETNETKESEESSQTEIDEGNDKDNNENE